MLGVAGRPGLRNGLALADLVTTPHDELAEMGQRGLVAVRRDDRDRRPVRGHLTRERHVARDGCANHRGAVERDVDAAVLSPCIRVVAD